MAKTLTNLSSGPWSKDAVKILKRIYRNASDKDVARELCRSVHSVRAKARALGLTKTKKYLKSIGRA